MRPITTEQLKAAKDSHSCKSSTQAAQKLEAAGFSNVYDYEGGAKAWQEAGLAVGS